MKKCRIKLGKACMTSILFLMTASFAIAYPNQGDWVITDSEIIEDETININGNIVVTNSGSLTLRAVNLIINNAYSGQFNISVESGGSLNIHDSNIKPHSMSYPFGIRIEDGSLVLNNNRIAGVGFISQDGMLYPALEINSVRNALIKGNHITNVDSIIFRLTNVTDSEITENIIETFAEENEPFPFAFEIDHSSNNIISKNNIVGIYTGMAFFNQSSQNYVASNSLTPGTANHLGNGIYLDTDSNNNSFYSNTIGGPSG